METLPMEMIESITQWLTPRDLAQCSAVSRSWYEMINQDRIWRPHCDPDFEEPLRTIPNAAAPKFEIPQAKTLPPISRWKMAFLRERHLFKNWSPEIIMTLKEENVIRTQWHKNPLKVDFFSDTLIVVWFSFGIKILDVSVTPAIVVAQTGKTVSLDSIDKLCMVGTDLILVRRRTFQKRESIKVFKVNTGNKSITLEYKYIFSISYSYLGLKDNFYLFVDDEREKLKILDLNTGRILKEDACPEEVDEKYSVSLESVTCSPTSEFVGVLFRFESNEDEDYWKVFVYSLKHLTFLPGPGIIGVDHCLIISDDIGLSRSIYVALNDHWLAFSSRRDLGIKIFKLSESGVHFNDEISLPTVIQPQIVVCNGYFVFFYRPMTKGESHIRIYSPSSKNLTIPISVSASVLSPYHCNVRVVNNKFIAVFNSDRTFISTTVWKPSGQKLEKCDFSVVRNSKVNQSFTKVINHADLAALRNQKLNEAALRAWGSQSCWFFNHLW